MWNYRGPTGMEKLLNYPPSSATTEHQATCVCVRPDSQVKPPTVFGRLCTVKHHSLKGPPGGHIVLER